MDLLVNQDEMQIASNNIKNYSEDIRNIKSSLKSVFDILREEWNSEAGKKYVDKYEKDVLDNLDKYSIVFDHMSENLIAASHKYDEVFRAADAVANAQY